MNGFTRRVAVAAVAAALTLAMFGGAASAGAASSRPLSTRGAHPHRAAAATPGARAAVATTDEGAGYWLYPTAAHGLASVNATFTLPAFTCQRSGDKEWLLPGIWVFSQGALTEQIDANLNCNSGSVLQVGFACLTDGCGTSLAVSPGDVMKASIAYTPTATIATLKDVTAHTTSQFVGAVNTTDDVVLVGDVGPDWFFGGVITRVPTFTSVPFSSVQINGQDLVDGPAPSRYNLKTNNVVQIKTGAITKDTNFKTTFAHN